MHIEEKIIELSYRCLELQRWELQFVCSHKIITYLLVAAYYFNHITLWLQCLWPGWGSGGADGPGNLWCPQRRHRPQPPKVCCNIQSFSCHCATLEAWSAFEAHVQRLLDSKKTKDIFITCLMKPGCLKLCQSYIMSFIIVLMLKEMCEKWKLFFVTWLFRKMYFKSCPITFSTSPVNLSRYWAKSSYVFLICFQPLTSVRIN